MAPLAKSPHVQQSRPSQRRRAMPASVSSKRQSKPSVQKPNKAPPKNTAKTIPAARRSSSTYTATTGTNAGKITDAAMQYQQQRRSSRLMR